MPRKRRLSARVHKQSLSKVISAMMGRGYKFGGNGETIGNDFDCFGMLVEYVKLRYGLNILELQKGLDLPFFTYKEKDLYSHIFLMTKLKEYLDKYFSKILLPYILPGDIIWAEADALDSMGIYLGSQRLLVTAPEVNCTTIPTEYYELKDAYRWLLLSR